LRLNHLRHATINTAKPALLLAALFPFITLLGFQLHQKAVRHRMKEEMEKQCLHTITLQQQEFHWVEEGKELWVNNRLFDVKSFHVENGTYSFTGLYDEEETSLVKSLQQNEGQRNTPENKLLTEFFQLLNAPPPGDPTGYFGPSGILTTKFPDKKALLTTRHIATTTPPPKA
jgi:hypothetical protein